MSKIGGVLKCAPDAIGVQGREKIVHDDERDWII